LREPPPEEGSAFLAKAQSGAIYFSKTISQPTSRLSPQIDMTIRAGADESKSSGVGVTGEVCLNEAHFVRRFFIEFHNSRPQFNNEHAAR
jgi:hypothetical protein